jgi:hypothetical protein
MFWNNNSFVASNTYAKVRNEIFFGGLSDRDKKCEAKETKVPQL